MPDTAPRQRLEINQRPRRDLRALLERVGQTWVERQLNVHRTTVLRWLKGQVQIPGHQHLAIRMLLGDLPGTAGKWTGWRFHDGELISPGGDRFSAGHVLSLVFLRQQLSAQKQQIDALRVKLKIAENTIARLAPTANDAQAGYISPAANDSRAVG